MMQKIRVTCPCCGRSFVISITADDICMQAAEPDDVARIASDLGFEIATKGGEKIGD